MSIERTVRVGTSLLGVVCAMALGACEVSHSQPSNPPLNGMDASTPRTVLLRHTQPKASADEFPPTAVGGGPADRVGENGVGNTANNVQAQPVAGVWGPGSVRQGTGLCESSEAGVGDPDCDEAGVHPSPAAPAIPSETSAECPPATNCAREP